MKENVNMYLIAKFQIMYTRDYEFIIKCNFVPNCEIQTQTLKFACVSERRIGRNASNGIANVI